MALVQFDFPTLYHNYQVTPYNTLFLAHCGKRGSRHHWRFSSAKIQNCFKTFISISGKTQRRPRVWAPSARLILWPLKKDILTLAKFWKSWFWHHWWKKLEHDRLRNGTRFGTKFSLSSLEMVSLIIRVTNLV